MRVWWWAHELVRAATSRPRPPAPASAAQEKSSYSRGTGSAVTEVAVGPAAIRRAIDVSGIAEEGACCARARHDGRALITQHAPAPAGRR